ncbi:MAG: PEP-CTERM sorting domain-containing protein [Verrucomicrobiota bacterium]
MSFHSLDFFKISAVALAPLAIVPEVFGTQAYYDLTVYNDFANGEYYGATPSSSDIWLLSNFEFDYNTSSGFVKGNSSAGTYGTAVRLSDIDGGKMRIYSTDGGTRIYSVLSQGSTAPTFSDLDSKPNNYFEWSFSSSNPGTLDMSWIDSFDYLSRLKVSAKGTSSPAPTIVTFGAGSSKTTQQVGSALNTYVNQTGGNYSWLGTSGYSTSISYTGATNAVRWITNNSGTAGSINAQNNKSYTRGLDNIITEASNSTHVWKAGTPATGPNWTDKGFRISGLQGVSPPDGSTLSDTATMWSAYVNFTKDQGTGKYTMVVTEFTIYGGTGTNASYKQLWTAGATTYSVTQDDGALDAIWTSSVNNLSSTPAWITNLGANNNNLFYALYNAIASGVIYNDDFVSDTTLPSWTGYVPYVAGQQIYNFEILFQGGQVDQSTYPGGLTGNLTGTDLVALMKARDSADDLINPYFLELLSVMHQTPAYLFPSQDFWGSESLGSDSYIGLQPGPLNGDDVFGDATFDWYLGSKGSDLVIPEPRTAVAFGAGALALAVYMRRRRKGQKSES